MFLCVSLRLFLLSLHLPRRVPLINACLSVTVFLLPPPFPWFYSYALAAAPGGPQKSNGTARRHWGSAQGPLRGRLHTPVTLAQTPLPLHQWGVEGALGREDTVPSICLVLGP